MANSVHSFEFNGGSYIENGAFIMITVTLAHYFSSVAVLLCNNRSDYRLAVRRIE